MSLFAHPKPALAERKADGWTAADIAAYVERRLRDHLEPVGIGAKEYTYDRVLERPR